MQDNQSPVRKELIAFVKSVKSLNQCTLYFLFECQKNAYAVLCNPNYKNLPVTISNSCMTHSKNAWIFEDSGYPVRMIVPHLSQNWWYITVTSFKWLPNKIGLVQERTEQVKPRLLCSHGQIQKGPWPAVNKQNNFYAFSRHRHRSLGLDRFSSSRSPIHTLSNTNSMTLSVEKSSNEVPCHVQYSNTVKTRM